MNKHLNSCPLAVYTSAHCLPRNIDVCIYSYWKYKNAIKKKNYTVNLLQLFGSQSIAYFKSLNRHAQTFRAL